MKRAGNLYNKIADPDNLRLAFVKAAKGKAAKKDVQDFRKDLGKNLNLLRNQLLATDVELGNYNYFTIYDPKERVICAAAFPERVLHHAIMNICHPYFEKYQIYDSYATRIDKGTYAAIERACNFNKNNYWYLKLDIRKYFDNIDHGILLNLLSNRFKDKHLISLFKKIIDSYETYAGKGIPIGNLTSQYFANLYLATADHYAKEKLKIKNYVRYMDDIVLWSTNKEELKQNGNLFREFIAENLNLNFKQYQLNKITNGLPFLGYRIFKSKIKLSTRSKTRYKKKIFEYSYKLKAGIWDEKEYQNHMLPLIEFTNHANAKSYRRNLIEQLSGQWPWVLTG